MDLKHIRNLILDTDEKIMRVGEEGHEDDFPDTKDTYDRLLSDLMCRLIQEFDIPLGELANYWHLSDDCTWPLLPEFANTNAS